MYPCLALEHAVLGLVLVVFILLATNLRLSVSLLSPSHSAWFEFLFARREVVSVFLKDRTAYERKLSIFARRSPKVFWRYVNSQLSIHFSVFY